MLNITSTIRVECYAGYRGDETPRRFFLGEREVDVVEVVDRWFDPEHHYFKVRGNDGCVYILRQDIAKDKWEMILFDSNSRQETRLSST